MPGPCQSVKVAESQAFDSLNSYDHYFVTPVNKIIVNHGRQLKNMSAEM